MTVFQWKSKTEEKKYKIYINIKVIILARLPTQCNGRSLSHWLIVTDRQHIKLFHNCRSKPSITTNSHKCSTLPNLVNREAFSIENRGTKTFHKQLDRLCALFN